METKKRSKGIKEGLKGTYAAIAQHFDVTRWQPWPETKVFAEMLINKREKTTVLDLGCGNGRNAVYLAKMGHRVIALDCVPEQLSVARGNAEREGVAEHVEFVEAMLPYIPLNDSTVDAVLYIATLHHLPTVEERVNSLEEVARVLKSGGEMLVSVWAIEQAKFESEFSKHRILAMEPGDVSLPWTRQVDCQIFYRYYHFFAKEEFLELFEDNDLEVVEYFYRADNHYARAVKP